jgi:hypothetical protein
MCIWLDQDLISKNGSKNGGSGLLYQNVEVRKKGLHMDGGPTMPPHLHQHYWCSSESVMR